MARKVIGRLNSWPRRWRVLLTLVLAAGVGFTLMRTVQAVHTLDFELDGNIINDGATVVGNFDWADFFLAAPEPTGAVPVDPLPPNFGAAGFVRDFVVNANGSFNKIGRAACTGVDEVEE